MKTARKKHFWNGKRGGGKVKEKKGSGVVGRNAEGLCLLPEHRGGEVAKNERMGALREHQLHARELGTLGCCVQ